MSTPTPSSVPRGVRETVFNTHLVSREKPSRTRVTMIRLPIGNDFNEATKDNAVALIARLLSPEYLTTTVLRRDTLAFRSVNIFFMHPERHPLHYPEYVGWYAILSTMHDAITVNNWSMFFDRALIQDICPKMGNSRSESKFSYFASRLLHPNCSSDDTKRLVEYMETWLPINTDSIHDLQEQPPSFFKPTLGARAYGIFYSDLTYQAYFNRSSLANGTAFPRTLPGTRPLTKSGRDAAWLFIHPKATADSSDSTHAKRGMKRNSSEASVDEPVFRLPPPMMRPSVPPVGSTTRIVLPRIAVSASDALQGYGNATQLPPMTYQAYNNASIPQPPARVSHVRDTSPYISSNLNFELHPSNPYQAYNDASIPQPPARGSHVRDTSPYISSNLNSDLHPSNPYQPIPALQYPTTPLFDFAMSDQLPTLCSSPPGNDMGLFPEQQTSSSIAHPSHTSTIIDICVQYLKSGSIGGQDLSEALTSEMQNFTHGPFGNYLLDMPNVKYLQGAISLFKAFIAMLSYKSGVQLMQESSTTVLMPDADFDILEIAAFSKSFCDELKGLVDSISKRSYPEWAILFSEHLYFIMTLQIVSSRKQSHRGGNAFQDVAYLVTKEVMFWSKWIDRMLFCAEEIACLFDDHAVAEQFKRTVVAVEKLRQPPEIAAELSRITIPFSREDVIQRIMAQAHTFAHEFDAPHVITKATEYVNQIKTLAPAMSNPIFRNPDLVCFLPYTEYSHMLPEHHHAQSFDSFANVAKVMQ